MIRYIIIFLLFTVRFCLGCPDWLADESALWTRACLYPFFHASWLHLIINSAAIWTMLGNKHKDTCYVLPIGYLVSILVYPLAVHPCVGISNLLYAVLGMRTPPLSCKAWWTNVNVIIFLAVTGTMCFIPSISGSTHVAAFVAGIGIAYINRNRNVPCRR